MSKSPDVPELDIAEKRDWFSIRTFPVYIIAAWSLYPIFSLQWSPILKVLKTGELAGYQFLLIILHPFLLLLGGISLLLLRRHSVSLFIASLVIGIINLSIFSGSIVANIPFVLIIAFGVIIYCLWLRRSGILK